MIKTHWVKTAVACGTALTLSIAVGAVDTYTTASTLCKETEMAGISLSMDKYYADTYNNEETPAPTQEAEATEAPTAEATDKQPAATPAPTPQVSKQFLNTAISIADDYVNVRKSPSTEAKILGKLYEGCAAKVIETKDGWSRIESGSVNGYIKSEFLATGAEAEKLAEKYGKYYAKVKPGTITLNVRTKPSTKATILTQIPEDENFEVLKIGENWVKISIDGDKGYVAKEFVNLHASFKKAISIEEEEAEARRKAAAEAAEQERLAALEAERARQSSSSSSNSNSSSSSRSSSSSSRSSSSSSRSSSSSSRSSTSSSRSSSSSSRSTSSNRSSSSSNRSSSSYSGGGSGSEIASYAQKFVGNPYVYGGSSLTKGTDCSGFTMSIYAQFGYSLPHSAAAQSKCGRSVSLSSVQPGDLIFYKNGSRIGHVAMYIGGGQVVHASNPSDGIKISNMYYRKPCSARRIVG
ncbi:MAG: C40 family peptidase [Lachnospiraceae bacterium]|nr:C40 family peptidase [Lachnospiraceae bacterium]